MGDANSHGNLNSSISVNGADISADLESKEVHVGNNCPREVAMLRSIFRLPVTEVWRSDDCKTAMEYLKTFSNNTISADFPPELSSIVDNDASIEFFRNYIILVSENHSHMLLNTTQRQYITFIKFVMALWNLSDKSASLCARMAQFDAHTHLIRLLGKVYLSPKLLISKQLQIMILSVVGILHNINNKLHYTRSRYRDEHLVTYLMPLAALESKRDLIGLKTAALLLLAFLVNENENSFLNANDDHIIYILDILKQALESSELYSKYYGYHCLEILHSLRQIASPDNNKTRLINNGVLISIAVVLSEENETIHPVELVAGLDLLWSLSFSKECLQALSSDARDLKSRVEVLLGNTNKDIMLSARGIMWNIDSQRNQNINDLILEDVESPCTNGHVMISYKHSTQDMMIKIKDALTSRGYKVWMDVDHMRGSFVDAMAEGIQHSAVLLLGMCQAFKNSPHCRQEVKYAYTLRKPLVPVRLEEGFVADGWLGLMCATLIYADFVDPAKFETSMAILQNQLGQRGKICTRSVSCQDSIDGSFPSAYKYSHTKSLQEGRRAQRDSQSSHQMNVNIPNCRFDAESDHSSAFSQYANVDRRLNMSTESDNLPRRDSDTSRIEYRVYARNFSTAGNQARLRIIDWTSTQCMSWLVENNIDPYGYGYPLTHLNGALLFELAEMRQSAPKSYFTTATKELKLNFIDNLYLSRALRRLNEMTQ